MMEENNTDFGFEKVKPEEKTRRVTQVFTSVASNYDLMNDFMSFGIHRFWKRQAVHISNVRSGSRILDVAGGTGDMARLYLEKVGQQGQVVISDLNNAMLNEGRDRSLDLGVTQGLEYIQANAQCLPFANCSFDCVSISFGLRNVTDKQSALESMYEKLKFGGNVVILEFSTVVLPLLKRLYDIYSFKLIPMLGKFVAKDEASYQYLVESIRMHPGQEELKSMMEQAGFSRVEYFNLSGGIVAIHRGYKI